MSTKKLIQLLSTLLVSVSLIAACGGTATPQSALPAPKVSTAVAPAQPPTPNPKGIVLEQAAGVPTEEVKDVPQEQVKQGATEATVTAYQQLGCPDASAPVHYSVNNGMTGLKFECDGSASRWQTGPNSFATLGLWADGENLHWQFPAGWDCTDNIGANKPSGEKPLAELFPDGTIPMGTTVWCSHDNVFYGAIYYMDTKWK